MGAPLRLVLFDATDIGVGRFRRGRGPRGPAERGRAAGAPARPDGAAGTAIGLTPIWAAGALLHRVAGAADAQRAVTSWGEALAWAVRTARERGRKIASLQAWGHGGWGYMRLGTSRLDEAALRPDAALAGALAAFRDELVGPDALVWLRCCSAFGHTGRSFARALADRLGCRVASHTYIIGLYQSGTHSLRPGETPGWDPREGVRFHNGAPVGAKGSSPAEPNTVSCFTLDLPRGY